MTLPKDIENEMIIYNSGRISTDNFFIDVDVNQYHDAINLFPDFRLAY